MRYIKQLGTIAVAALLLGTSGLKAQTADSEHVTKLLSDARAHAISAEEDAELLESFTRSKLALTTHGGQLEMIRGHVNDLGRTVNDLKAARAEASPWQQQAIDRIDPLLQEMADTLTATIKHLNDNPSHIHMQAYRDYATATHDVANRTASAIRDLVEYGKSRARAAELEQKLEVDPNKAGR